MDEMDKSVHCKVSLSERTVDILCKMAEEDHVSLTTEIENAISGWYRMRYGFKFPGIEKIEPCNVTFEEK